jgi:predicted nucleic-acid-binding protein
MKKTAVDTNILVRFLVDDDGDQSRVALQLFRSRPLYILKTVLLETEWVLRSVLKADRRTICRLFSTLLAMPHLHFEDPATVSAAVARHAAGMDFADALHMSALDDDDRLLTFDRDFVRMAAKTTDSASVALAQ